MEKIIAHNKFCRMINCPRSYMPNDNVYTNTVSIIGIIIFTVH